MKATRKLAASVLATTLHTGVVAHATPASAPAPAAVQATVDGDYIVTVDGVRLYYKDWGPKDGEAITFSHGWPLNSDSWESQMLFLADKGYRVVAHDRRGHGRSSQPWNSNDMDHYADDLAAVINSLDLNDVTVVGFSTGGGEVARYIGRHGTSRVKKAALISAVPPMLLKTPNNPGGLPIEVYDGLRKASLENRAELYREIAAGSFYGFNRPGAKISQGLIDSWFAQAMQAGHKNTYDSIAAFSASDFRDDLKKFDVPTLVVHGDDDQLVPLDISGKAAAKLVKGSKLIIYPGAPHGLTDTHKDQFNRDLLEFLQN